jgi:hypothetical protein
MSLVSEAIIRTVPLFSAILLAACGGKDGMLSQIPADIRTIGGAYRQAADCTYNKLRETEASGAQKADLSDRSIVALDSGQVRYWEISFRPDPTSPSRTLVEVTSAKTMWGGFPVSRAIEMIRTCSKG